MKRKPTPENPDWNLSFWVVALWPVICLAIVPLGFLAADLVKAL